MIRTRSTGWLGIDIGTTSVKVAQLVRDVDRVRVLARAIVPRTAHTLAEGPEEESTPVWAAAGEIRAAVALDGSFRGRHASVTMPMGFCDVHSFDHVAADDLDGSVRSAIEAITQHSADDLEFDIWPSEIEGAGPNKWNVLAVARPWAEQIYQDVVASGLYCHTIDGLPHALARAVALTAGDEPLPPTAVLDWGFSQATFCVVADGSPAYVRNLKDCSLERVLSAIASDLGVTLDEAHVLLTRHGVRGLRARCDDEVAMMIGEIVGEPIRHLEQEITRTLSHLGFQRKAISPQRLQLFGGGAMTAGLAKHLVQRLRIETCVWSLNEESSNHSVPDCLLGPALALSALAWEER